MKYVVRFFGLLLAITLPMVGLAQEKVIIEAFDSAGQLTFSTVPNAEGYRVEWASSLEGPWTNFADGASAALDHIDSTDADSVTVSVPMLYRVVAMFIPSGMVLIPGGTNSGTNPLGVAWGEEETHDPGGYPATYSLTVDSFYMDQYPVTKALWDEVYAWATHADRGANVYNFDNAGSGKGTNHPVHTVNWYDVVKWCNARSEMEGRSAVYTVNGAVYRTGQEDDVVQTDAAGYRLPTDVEWEYAARGGLQSKRFPWGDEIQHARANYHSDAEVSYDTSPTRGQHPTYNDGNVPYTSPVGSFAATGYGLYDMAGNLNEWVFDWHPFYVLRVLRGGSWAQNANDCRVGNRPILTTSDYAFYFGGFRTVMSLDQ